MQMPVDLGPPGGFWRMAIASIPTAVIAGVTAVIIQGQTITELRVKSTNDEGDIKVLEQRFSDLDNHGSRQVALLEGRMKSVEDRHSEEERRLSDIFRSMSDLNNRLILTEDRLIACQACHMGSVSGTLTDHLVKQRQGQSRSVPLPQPAPPQQSPLFKAK